tara:strand:- start:1510 stop:2172 length:663 start_codon:yes stop_codon:yes gene_type:complete
MKLKKVNFLIVTCLCLTKIFSQDYRDIRGDGDYVLNLEIEGGYGMLATNFDIPNQEKIEEYMLNTGFGLSLTKRLSYTTKLSVGANYVELIPKENYGQNSITSTLQFPLRIYKIFASKGRPAVHTEKNRFIKIPYGFTLAFGGYTAIDTKRLLTRINEYQASSNNMVFGASFGFGYMVRNFSFIVEARQDMFAPDKNFDNWSNIKRVNLSVRLSFGIIDF